ncbi:MAG: hypothetical protein ABEL76_01685 [Bradymonadaceae bacterium]
MDSIVRSQLATLLALTLATPAAVRASESADPDAETSDTAVPSDRKSPDGSEASNPSEEDEPAPPPVQVDDSGPAASYETAQVGDSQFFSRKHRKRLYRKGRLKYSKAALLTLAFPSLGNFYARQYLIGGLTATLMAFSAVLIPYGLVTDQTMFSWIGAGTAGAAYGTGLVTTYFGVRRYNHKLRRRLRLTETAGGNRGRDVAIGPAVGFRF